MTYAPMFVVGQTDTLPPYTATLTDQSGNPVNLTTATSVTFIVSSYFTGNVVDSAAAVVSASHGVVSYSWAQNDLNTPGVYSVEWLVVWSGGGVTTYPLHNYNFITVLSNLAIGFPNVSAIFNTIITGTSAPTSAQGNNGDFFYNSTSQFFYGPKASGSWPSGFSMTFSGTPAGGDLGGTYPNPQVTSTHLISPLPVAQGGTGSITQNFVDISTAQTTIAGNKTFTGNTTTSGTLTASGGLAATEAAGAGAVATVTNTTATPTAATVQLTAQSAADKLLALQIAADTVPRVAVDSNGKHAWGPGGSTASDTNLYRTSAGVLKTDNTFNAGTAVQLENASVNSAASLTNSGSTGVSQLQSDSGLLSTSTTKGIGYATGGGVGGTVTQLTNKSTGVTLNKLSGTITMIATGTIATGAVATFTLTNSSIAATDLLALNHTSTGTLGAYGLTSTCAGGSAVINVRNLTSAGLTEGPVLQFVVIKAATT